MSKIIERADSTTVMVEIPHHLIKDAQEVKNIFAAAPPDSKVQTLQRSVDMKTFQPQISFRLISPKLTFKAEYYIATIEHLIDSGVDFKPFEFELGG